MNKTKLANSTYTMHFTSIFYLTKMRNSKKRAASKTGMADSDKQLIGKAMALSPAIRNLRILEDSQVHTASARYYLRTRLGARS